MKLAWKQLIRFVGSDGEIHHGEPLISSPEDLHEQLEAGKLHAKCISGDIFSETAVADVPTLKVEKLLGPLASQDVPLVKGIGLNYLAHSTLIEDGYSDSFCPLIPTF